MTHSIKTLWSVLVLPILIALVTALSTFAQSSAPPATIIKPDFELPSFTDGKPKRDLIYSLPGDIKKEQHYEVHFDYHATNQSPKSEFSASIRKRNRANWDLQGLLLEADKSKGELDFYASEDGEYLGILVENGGTIDISNLTIKPIDDVAEAANALMLHKGPAGLR